VFSEIVGVGILDFLTCGEAPEFRVRPVFDFPLAVNLDSLGKTLVCKRA
jgi:hypothetical protein